MSPTAKTLQKTARTVRAESTKEPTKKVAPSSAPAPTSLENSSEANIPFAQRSLSTADVLHLQRTIGNRAATRAIHTEIGRNSKLIQRATVALNGETYKIVEPVPGTNMRVVRLNYKPWADKFIYTPDGGGRLLPMPLTNKTEASLRGVFADLEGQGVRKLDEMMLSLEKAYLLATPVPVLIGRLKLINENIRNVVMLRLRADHAGLKANGLIPANVSANFDIAFNSLEIPGSDPHKGGQVVVFAKYNTTDPATKAKIVYKPGDLGVDKFLFGSNPESIASSLGTNMASYQIVDKVDATAIDDRLAHYGYMEFVKTEGPQNAADVTSLYESLGEALVTAYVFGLRDIHEGNYLMRRDRIMLLDMEAATGTFSGFTNLDQRNLFRDIEEKIADAFGNQTHANFIAPGFIPDDAALSASVITGATRQLTNLQDVNTDASGNDYAGTFAAKRARFVPIATNLLAGLGSNFVTPQPSQRRKDF